uniref:Large ribosomal subunit protein bL19m n=1 Tax=Cebus imitator TaxID=2715852 RepID=A0A2K5PDX9_CEBIM
MASCIAAGQGAAMGLGRTFQAARTLLCAQTPVACRFHAGNVRPQSPGPSIFEDKHRLAQRERRFLSPGFIPRRGRTHPLKFQIERKDMLERRKVPHIPEFYVGSILRVTTSDQYANGKISQFLGICIQRSGKGLGATLILRNIIEGQGVEICFELYNPRIQEIQVVKLEKRLDDGLLYLRDATFDVNMKPVPQEPTQEIPVNMLKVKMKPKPWSKCWERPNFNIKGIRFDLCLTEKQMKEAQKWSQPWLEFDTMRE